VAAVGETMAGRFDPYHRWLGIPPKDQPPNHYRLLGLQLFEADADVIESAADQRMAHLRTFQTGKHSPLSQKLLNEVAAAKLCLFSPQKRAAYDELLRQKLPERAAEVPAPQAAEPVGPELAGLFAQADRATPAVRTRVTARKRSAKPAILVALVVATGLVILGLIIRGVLSTGETALLLDWPEDQREGATLKIDGRPYDVEPSGPLRHRCSPDKHRIVATRPGFQPFVKTVTLEEGRTEIVRPTWIVLAPEGRPPRGGTLPRGDPTPPGIPEVPEEPREPPPLGDPRGNPLPGPLKAKAGADVPGPPKESAWLLDLGRGINYVPVAVREPPADAKVYLELSGVASWPIPAEFKGGKSQAQVDERISIELRDLPGAQISVTLVRHIGRFKLRIQSDYSGPEGKFPFTPSDVGRRADTVSGELKESEAELQSLPPQIRQNESRRAALQAQLQQAQARRNAPMIPVLRMQIRNLTRRIDNDYGTLKRLPKQIENQRSLCKVLPELRRAVDSLHGKAQLECRVFAKSGEEELDLIEGKGEP